MVANVLVKRTSTDNSPPTGLIPGELACEMGTPLRLWIGVPTALDPSGKKLLAPLGGVTVADAPPAAPKQGDLWWESDAGILWLWYDDGNSAQWVQAAGSGGSTLDAYTKAESDGKFVELAGDTMTGNLKISAVDPALTLDKTALNQTPSIVSTVNGSPRWIITPGGGDETGVGNVGGNFAIIRYDDAGNRLGPDEVLAIVRETGQAIFGGAFLEARNTGANSVLRTNAASTTANAEVQWCRAGVMYSSALQSPTGLCIYSDQTYGPGVFLPTSGTAWVAASDARLPHKLTAAPVANVLDRLGSVQLYSNVALTGKVELFVKAQELAASLPELVYEPATPQAKDPNYQLKSGEGGNPDPNMWGVMYDRCGAVALQAIKELKAEVDALKAQLAA